MSKKLFDCWACIAASAVKLKWQNRGGGETVFFSLMGQHGLVGFIKGLVLQTYAISIKGQSFEYYSLSRQVGLL